MNEGITHQTLATLSMPAVGSQPITISYVRSRKASLHFNHLYSPVHGRCGKWYNKKNKRMFVHNIQFVN